MSISCSRFEFVNSYVFELFNCSCSNPIKLVSCLGSRIFVWEFEFLWFDSLNLMLILILSGFRVVSLVFLVFENQIIQFRT